MNLSTIENSLQDQTVSNYIQLFKTYENAINRGYYVHENGDTTIYYHNNDGTLLTYLCPHTGENKPYTRTRLYKPLKDGTRYLSMGKKETNNFFEPFRTTIEVQDAYNAGEKIETLYIFEGEKKADKAAHEGVMSASFSGISVFWLTDSLKDLIKTCNIERIVLVYDGDCNDLSKEPFKGKSKKGRKKSINTRTRNFYYSAYNFAESLHEWLELENMFVKPEEKHNIQLIHASGQPGQEKALDDMIIANPENTQIIMDSLTSHKSNDYFHFFTLPRTQFKRKLLSFFHLDSVRSFYKSHKETIGEKTFTFAFSAFCKCRYKFDRKKNCLICLDNPFSTDIKPKKTYSVDTYTGEKQKALFADFERLQKILLDVPTGAGKTTISLLYASYFVNSNTKGNVYVIVPTVKLGEQLAQKYDKRFVYESVQDFTKGLPEDASQTEKLRRQNQNERIVFCTYDSLRKLQPNENDLLIIDEAHNIVNQSTFRDLRYLYAATKTAKKVICLTATANNVFAKNEGFDIIKVTVKNRNQITFVPHILSGTSPTKAITAKLLSTDFEDDKTHFVFINSKKDLQAIRTVLTQSGILTIEQIALLTSERKNEDATFQDITQHSQIKKGIKLVLTTCIICEGINIENLNVGSVLIGGIRCTDSIIQFSGRFRNMKSLVIDLYFTNYKTNEDYYNDTQKRIENDLIVANSHVRIIQDHQNTQEQQPTKGVKKRYFYAYEDEEKNVQIDTLKIYADEYIRKVSTMPIEDILSELVSFENVTIRDDIQPDSITKEVTEVLSKAQGEARRTAKEQRIKLANDIQENEPIVLAALYDFAQEQNKKNTSELICEVLDISPEEIQATPEIRNLVTKYKEDNKHLLDTDTYAKFARQYCKIKKHIEDAPKALIKAKNESGAKRLIKSLENLKLIDDYDCKEWKRRNMSATDISWAKFYIKVQTVLSKELREVFNINTAYKLIRELLPQLTVIGEDGLKQGITKMKDSEIESLLDSLFDYCKLSANVYTGLTSKSYKKLVEPKTEKLSAKFARLRKKRVLS